MALIGILYNVLHDYMYYKMSKLLVWKRMFLQYKVMFQFNMHTWVKKDSKISKSKNIDEYYKYNNSRN